MKAPLVLTIGQLNAYVKSLLDGDDNLNHVYVSAEISNFTNHYRTGHFYFSLKDENAVIRAVMFRSSAQRLKFLPQDGMRVIVRGRVSLYEWDGQYQLYVDDLQPDGVGALNLAYEQLKEKLSKEGLFAPERKKTLPRYPMRVGVVTSPTGAAVRDIINVLSRRFPLAQIILQPVQVQGADAPGQIADAIRLFNEKKAADVLIVGRGGGSLEELWAFNEEEVARAVAASEIPVVSAVGHETDFTICDFAADLRAPTPSAAAELCVPDAQGELARVQMLRHSVFQLVQRRMDFIGTGAVAEPHPSPGSLAPIARGVEKQAWANGFCAPPSAKYTPCSAYGEAGCVEPFEGAFPWVCDCVSRRPPYLLCGRAFGWRSASSKMGGWRRAMRHIGG